MSQLSGVRVLDVATLYPAPLLAAMLGDFGADVVKVEPPSGDPLRAIGGAVPWSIVGRNKRSVVVDFDTPDGLANLHALAAAADIVVFNQPRRVLERWGCSDDDIATRNADTIIVHLTAFGMTGPYADRPGNGTLAEAFVGISGTSTPLGDTVGAITGVIGALLALYARDTARGANRVVDVSLYESLLPLLAPSLGGLESVPSVRESFVASDGRSLVISATTPAQLERLRDLAGDDPAGWVSTRTATAAVDALVDARVPAVEVNDVLALRSHPQVAARGSIAAVGDAPGVGDHTDEVLREWLYGGDA